MENEKRGCRERTKYGISPEPKFDRKPMYAFLKKHVPTRTWRKQQVEEGENRTPGLHGLYSVVGETSIK